MPKLRLLGLFVLIHVYILSGLLGLALEFAGFFHISAFLSDILIAENSAIIGSEVRRSDQGSGRRENEIRRELFLVDRKIHDFDCPCISVAFIRSFEGVFRVEMSLYELNMSSLQKR